MVYESEVVMFVWRKDFIALENKVWLLEKTVKKLSDMHFVDKKKVGRPKKEVSNEQKD